MLATFGLGLIVGILIVIFLLKMTMTTDPKGCILFVSFLLILLFWTISVGLWLLLGG